VNHTKDKKTHNVRVMDWVIMMFDHEVVKWCETDLKSINNLFPYQIYNWGCEKNMRLKYIMTRITTINIWLFKIYTTNFLNEFFKQFPPNDTMYL